MEKVSIEDCFPAILSLLAFSSSVALRYQIVPLVNETLQCTVRNDVGALD